MKACKSKCYEILEMGTEANLKEKKETKDETQFKEEKEKKEKERNKVEQRIKS